MEDEIIPEEKLNFLPKPKLNYETINYIKEKKEIYTNLFQFGTKKDLKLYKYPFLITPEVGKNAYKLMQSIIRYINKELRSIYGAYIISLI